MILDERFNTSYITLYQFRVWLFLYLPVFQNISCYPLSNILYNQRWLFVVSIHPILLFINKDNPLNHQNQQFQHIPCYSLSQYRQVFYSVGTVSIHLMLLFILATKVRNYLLNMFQYISCYSLSESRARVCHIFATFQYISCYSLSVWNLHSWLLRLCFSTSHVTLYRLMERNMLATMGFQYISCYSLSRHKLSNHLHEIVSIHLMLLFIILNTYPSTFRK